MSNAAPAPEESSITWPGLDAPQPLRLRHGGTLVAPDGEQYELVAISRKSRHYGGTIQRKVQIVTSLPSSAEVLFEQVGVEALQGLAIVFSSDDNTIARRAVEQYIEKEAIRSALEKRSNVANMWRLQYTIAVITAMIVMAVIYVIAHS